MAGCHSEGVLGPFRALVFDQDGTLIDTEPAHFAAWSKVAAESGLSFGGADFARFAGQGDPVIASHLAELAGCDPVELVERKRRHYRQVLDRVALMPGVRRLLEEGKAADLPMAVATLSPEDETLRVLRALGIDGYFAAVVHRHSEDPQHPGRALAPKPAPDIYLLAARLLAVEPRQCCAFEDSFPGARAAKQAGMAAIVIPAPYSRHLDCSFCDACLGSLAEAHVDLAGRVRVGDRRRPAR